MNQENQFNEDDCLTQRLRHEARQSRPPFSETLYMRVLSAVRAASSTNTASAGRRQRALIGRTASWALAACASIAVTIAMALVLHYSRLNRPNTVVQFDLPDAVQRQAAGDTRTKGVAPADAAASNAADDFDSVAEDVARSASGIGDWVQSAADVGQWGGLDRDIQAAWATVVGPLPFDLSLSIASDEK
jgi:hypothetical protein